MEVNGTSIPTVDVKVVEADQIGFAGLNADSFMKLLITELQNQDPLDPVDNGALLQQLSMMRNLQSNIELGDAIKAITNDQQLATAASFIGKTVTGLDPNKQEITGVADRAFLRDGTAYVSIDSVDVRLSDVNSVEQSAA